MSDDATQPAAPTAKPKPGTSAYCQTLKSASSRSSCLKKVSAQSKEIKALSAQLGANQDAPDLRRRDCLWARSRRS
jgi:hypothetical protein